eukprot:COSAG01_NODE_31625_length_593_cov_1.016162_1_plen_63_part_10
MGVLTGALSRDLALLLPVGWADKALLVAVEQSQSQSQSQSAYIPYTSYPIPHTPYRIGSYPSQ